MAKEVLTKLFRSRQALRNAQWVFGCILAALLLWVVAGWAALQGPMHLGTLRQIWKWGLLAAVAGGAGGWWVGRIAFAAWVAREERACGVPQLWSTVIGVAPENPFFARLNFDSLAAIQARRAHFRRATMLRWLSLVVTLGALAGTGRCGRALLREPKIRMALGLLDDSIATEAPESIAKGDPWTLRVRTLQAGPWVADMHGIAIPLAHGTLALQSLVVDTKYRILTAWGESAWKRVSVYEPVAWERLQLVIAPPAYLQLPIETLDVRTAAPKIVVAGSRLTLRGAPAMEWSDSRHGNDWTAKPEETDRVRPVKDGRHGAWTTLPIRVVADAPPDVHWVRPEGDVSWGPKQTEVEIDAADDWNVCEVTLQIRRLGAEDGVTRILYRGRERERTATTTVTPGQLPRGASPGIYELTPSATDSAGQTAAGEKRFLEVKPEPKESAGGGGAGASEHTSLRGLIVALLDTLRDWNRGDRGARLGRVRLELDSMAATAETESFRKGAADWIERLRDTATHGDVEGVVQEMVQIQQKGESEKPAAPAPKEKEPQAGEGASAGDIEKIETLQRAAMDPGISPQLRDNLQKQLQEQFRAKSDALRKQLPGETPLIREIGMNQEKLTRQWSEDLAKTHLQQLGVLKQALGHAAKGTPGQGGPSQQQLLDSVKSDAEGDKAVGGESLGRMRELSSQDSKIDWPAMVTASEKWNRALQSGIPSLQSRTKENLLKEIQKGQASGQGTSGSPLDQGSMQAFLNAMATGDWKMAQSTAKGAGIGPGLRDRMMRAADASPQDQAALKQELLAALLKQSNSAAQQEARGELEKVMPIDPSWEPVVDKYFQILNQRKAPPAP